MSCAGRLRGSVRGGGPEGGAPRVGSADPSAPLMAFPMFPSFSKKSKQFGGRDYYAVALTASLPPRGRL